MMNLLLVVLMATAPSDRAATVHDEIAVKLAPTAKQKLVSIAATLPATNNTPEGTSRSIRAAFPGVSFSQLDLDSLCAFVLQEAATQTQQNMKTTVDEIKTINQQKSALRADDKKKLETLNQMSNMMEIKMQMLMQRRSKFMSTLSGLLKKISDTQSAIISSLK
jgi:septal ring factor EnvC (AmiA/AmiB activator)